jgi:hypothetical protein
VWIRVLTLDAENETAWKALGGVHTKRRGWRLRVRGRFYTLEDMRERVSDWKNAMELPTAHFLIRTDIAPERAVDLSVDIERAYLTYYELFGRTLHLYPFDEVPEIRVYSDAKDYERPPNPGVLAWFAPNANILHVDASDPGAAAYAAVSELTEVLMFNSLRRTVGKTGSVPAWAGKGIAQAFAAAYRSDPGHATWDLTQPIRAHFDTHARAEDPLSIKDVVRSGHGSYDAGTDAALRLAQSYTLAHFLSHGSGGELRAGFAEYLVGAFGGQGSSTHLEKALDIRLKDLEERWIAYVDDVAGN